MAFVVEDGTGKSDSNSLCDITFYKAYFGDKGDDDAMSKVDSEIQFALIKGTAYVEATFRDSFVGRKAIRTQSLSWPRSSAYEEGFSIDNNIIPLNVKKAVCEAAKQSYTNDLFASIKPGAGNIIEKTIGPITTKWSPGAYQPLKTYPIIDKLLAGLLSEGYGNPKILRS